MSDLEYKNKYLKYKSKYLELKKELENSNLEGGGVFSNGYYVFFTGQQLSKDEVHDLNWINNLGIFYYIKIGKPKLWSDLFSTYNTIYVYNPSTKQSSPLSDSKQKNSYIEDINNIDLLTKISDAHKKIFNTKGCYLYSSVVLIEKDNNKIKIYKDYSKDLNKENICNISGSPSIPEMSGVDK